MISLKEVSKSQSKVHLGPQEVVLGEVTLRLMVTSSSWPAEEFVLRLGSHALMESLAWEIERLLFETQGADLARVDSVPVFPYKICRIVFESIANWQACHFFRTHARGLPTRELCHRGPGRDQSSVCQTLPDSGSRMLLIELVRQTTGRWGV